MSFIITQVGSAYAPIEDTWMTFSKGATKVTKKAGTEWNVKHRGRTWFPTARWYKRETVDLTLQGFCTWSERKFLEKYITLFGRYSNIASERYYTLTGLINAGIETTEIWVLNKPIEISPVNLYSIDILTAEYKGNVITPTYAGQRQALFSYKIDFTRKYAQNTY